jgi:hypothetical protein
MKKIILLPLFISVFCALNVCAQLIVVDNNTVKLGSNAFTYIGYQGKFEQANGFNVLNGLTGLIFEYVDEESAGMAFNGDGMYIWNPGDDNLINFMDEDWMTTNGAVYDATVAYIDGEGNYVSLSDSTRKERITTLSNTLPKITQLTAKQYYYKKNIDKQGSGNDTIKSKKEKQLQVGFLAQDVEKIIPEAVQTNKSGTKYINYSAIIPYLAEAIKEQQTVIEQQQADIAQMKQDIATLKEALKKN